MTGYLTPFAALVALIAKAFTSDRNTRKVGSLGRAVPSHRTRDDQTITLTAA